MPERSPLERSPLERCLRAECASPARVTPHHPTHADSFTHSASVLVRSCRAAARFRDHNAGITVTVSLHALANWQPLRLGVDHASASAPACAQLHHAFTCTSVVAQCLPLCSGAVHRPRSSSPALAPPQTPLRCLDL